MVFSRLPFFLKQVSPVFTRCFHREERVSVYGLSINTVKTGAGPRGLLLLPGAIGTAMTDFRKQIEDLPILLPDYKIVAWDPPGCGKTPSHQKTYCSDMFVDDANAAIDLMQTLKVGFFSVLGWNGGGTTALVMAGRFPQFIDKVVVWGATAFFSICELKKLDEYRSQLTKDAYGTINKPLEQFYGRERYTKKWTKYVEELSSIIKARDGDICKTEVDCIQAPTLILHGKCDPVISKRHPHYLWDHIKNSKYHEFPQGGHDIHKEFCVEFNDVVAKFLKEKNC